MVRLDRETREALAAEGRRRGRSLSETGYLLIREKLELVEVPPPITDPVLAAEVEELRGVVASLQEQVTALARLGGTKRR